MRIAPSIIIAACCLLFLSSCFTGIESTPRITSKDVERVVTASNAEAEIADKLSPPAITQWAKGRRFMVSDAKLSLLFEREPSLAPGDILVFDSLADEVSFTGDSVSVLSFHKYGSDSTTEALRYKMGMKAAEVPENTTLPMSVDLDMVDNARHVLLGKKYYIMSPIRVDSLLNITSRGRKLVAATICNVVPGNADYPLRVDISDDLGNISSVAMTVGTARSATRNFDRLFEINDPRLRYPAISDAVWDNIVNSRVAPGMTTIECHLALGSPRDIRKWHNGGSYFEGWACDNGMYIVFVDGVLSEIH